MPPELERCVTRILESDYAKKRWPDEEKRKSAAYAICNSQIKTSEGAFRYFTEIPELESDGKTWVHILSTGTYRHPKHGTIEITEDKLKGFVANFVSNVRGTELDVDFEHKTDASKGSKAAGWLRSLQIRGNELWGEVEFTDTAKAEIAEGAWRYVSAEYMDRWCNNAEEPECFDDVLFGVALTNRPFMKNLAPVNLSEVIGVEFPEEYDPFAFRDIPESQRKQHPSSDFAWPSTRSYPIFKCEHVRAAFASIGRLEGGNATDASRARLRSNIIRIARRKGFTACLPKSVKASEEVRVERIAALLGLSEDASDEDIEQAVRALTEEKRKEEKAKKFAEDYPEEAAKLAEREERTAKLERQLAEADITAKLTEWHVAGLPPAHDEDIKALVLGDKGHKSFEEVVEAILSTGLVKVGPRKLGAEDDPVTTNDPEEAILAKAKKYAEEHKVSFRKALAAVGDEEPELAKAYAMSATRGGE